MAEYLIQEETLTNLGDKIRVLSGTEDTMTPSAMTTNVDEANSEINSQAELLAQAVAALEGKVAGGGGSGDSLDNPFEVVPRIPLMGELSGGSFTVHYTSIANGLPCYCTTESSGNIVQGTTLTDVLSGTLIFVTSKLSSFDTSACTAIETDSNGAYTILLAIASPDVPDEPSDNPWG